MDEPDSRANGLRRRMQETRKQLYRDVDTLVRDAEGMIDWRRYVRRYPLFAVGAAAALGYFLVPRRRSAVRLDAETLAELAKTKRLVLRLEGDEPKTASASGTLTATILGIVGREAAGWLRKQFMDIVNSETGRQSEESRRRGEESRRFPDSENE